MSLFFLYHAWFSHNYFLSTFHKFSFINICFVSDKTGNTYKKKIYCVFGPSWERVKLRPGQLHRHGVHQRQGVCCDHAGTQKPQIRAFGRNWLKFGPLESFSRSGLLTKFQLIPVMILLLHLSHTSLLIVSWRRREGGKCMVPFWVLWKNLYGYLDSRNVANVMQSTNDKRSSEAKIMQLSEWYVVHSLTCRMGHEGHDFIDDCVIPAPPASVWVTHNLPIGSVACVCMCRLIFPQKSTKSGRARALKG